MHTFFHVRSERGAHWGIIYFLCVATPAGCLCYSCNLLTRINRNNILFDKMSFDMKLLQYCAGSNVGAKPAAAVPVSLTPLTFPISRSVLWDHRDVGPPTFVSIAHCRLIYIVLDLLT